MRYLTNLQDVNETEETVVTLGKFDGFHRGHRKIFNRVREVAKSNGLNIAAFTFAISPQTVLGSTAGQVLTTSKERKALIERAGADLLAECTFDAALRSMEPEQFVTEILLKRFRAKAVITGNDFRFGKDRRGDTELLWKCGHQFGFYTEAVEKERDGNRDISSTAVRDEVSAGNMETVSRMLGYDYFIQGPVTRGQKLGRTIGFPTANLIPQAEKILPPFGVYSSAVHVGDRCFRGITDIGTKPTVQGERAGVETYLFGFEGELYDQEIRVDLLHFMRGEQKFDSVAELKQQMKKDADERMTYEK